MNEEENLIGEAWRTKLLTVVIGEGSFTKGVYGKGKEGWQLEDTLDHFSKI